MDEPTEYAISCGLKVFKDFIHIHRPVGAADTAERRNLRFHPVRGSHDERDYDANQALLSATRWGHLDLIKYIVEQNNISVDSFTESLNIAANDGNLKLVKYLIQECDVDPNLWKPSIKNTDSNGYFTDEIFRHYTNRTVRYFKLIIHTRKHIWLQLFKQIAERNRLPDEIGKFILSYV